LRRSGRRDLQNFTAFLIGKKGYDRRTAHNKLAVVAQFLKTNDILRLLKKSDWPSYVEREPEVYEPEQLDKLLAACDLRNRVLFEFFLMTGMRDAEVRHTCWSDISSRQFARVKSKPEWHFTPKNWEEREVPIPDKLMQSLREYRSWVGAGSRLLFPATVGQPDRHFLRTLKRIAWTAGLNCQSCNTNKGRCRQGPFCEHWFLHKFRANWVAYSSNDSGIWQTYVVPFPIPDAGARYQISTDGGQQPRWRHDGRELFFLSPDKKLMAVSVENMGSTPQFGAPKVLFQTRAHGPLTAEEFFTYDVSADGQRFLINENAADNPIPADIILNWAD